MQHGFVYEEEEVRDARRDLQDPSKCRRRRQNVTGDDSPSTSLKLDIVKEPSVHQPHPGDDQRHVHH